MPTIKDLEARADAQGELDAMNQQTKDDVLTGDTRSAIGSMGLNTSAIEVTNDANKWIPLYHAYDGRVTRVPLYMLNQMNSLLAARFTHDSDIPPEYRGQRVWYSDPANVSKPEASTILCPISADQPDEVKALVREAGLIADCRKPGRFRTQFEADYHFQRKHPRRWAAYQRYLEAQRQTASSDQIAKVLEALMASVRGKEN